MSQSRIDTFKWSGRNGEPSSSLVDVTSFQGHGMRRNTYTYNDGRTCEHPDGKWHDCAYVDQRNALIPRATQMAGTQFMDGPDRDGKSWDQRYMEAMDSLWKGRAA
jgi:hypothetical protein